MDTTHVIVVEIPKPLWKNDNGSHGSWYAHNRLMQTLKRLGWATDSNWRRTHAGIGFERCRLDVYVQYPPHGRARADPSNADNVGKPIIDGFTIAGLWPDDNWRHVEGPFYRMSRTTAPKGLHRLEFHITDLTEHEENHGQAQTRPPTAQPPTPTLTPQTPAPHAPQPEHAQQGTVTTA